MNEFKFLFAVAVIICLIISCGETNKTEYSSPPKTDNPDILKQKQTDTYSNDSKEQEQKPKIKTENYLSADDIIGDFKSNQIRANNKYQNKKVTFKGNIYEITKSPTNYTIIEFDATSFSTLTIKCALVHSQDKKALQLSKDDEVIITGKCTGQLDKYDDIYFLDCTLK